MFEDIKRILLLLFLSLKIRKIFVIFEKHTNSITLMKVTRTVSRDDIFILFYELIFLGIFAKCKF